MRSAKLFVPAILLSVSTAVQAAGFEKNGNSITVHVNDPAKNGAKMVRLQVMNDRIIRVQATCEDAFPTKNSLMIVPQSEGESEGSAGGCQQVVGRHHLLRR